MNRGSIRSIFASWLILLYVDALMHFGGFSSVYKAVRLQVVRSTSRTIEDAHFLSHAVDLACVFYFKPVLCLQRSAALTVLLRRSGRDAEMIVGSQMFPFLSHAWVEAGGQVINDKPYVVEIFQELHRC